MGQTHRCQLVLKKKKKSPSPESRVPETGSDPLIGSGRDSGRDINMLRTITSLEFQKRMEIPICGKKLLIIENMLGLA